MDLLIGENNPASIKIGTVDVARIMFGEAQVWPREAPAPYATANPYYLTFSADGEALFTDITTNVTVRFEGTGDGMTVPSTTYSAGTFTISILWEGNITGSDRSASVYIVDDVTNEYLFTIYCAQPTQ